MSRPLSSALLAVLLTALAGSSPALAVFGDVDGNGSLGAEDVLLVQRSLRNGLILTPAQAAAANVVLDFAGEPPSPVVDVRDLGVLLRRISCLPAVCTGEIFASGGAGVQLGYCEYAPAVATPRYDACMGPRVLVDAGHNPFHRLDNSLSGLAKLLIADGYDVRPIVWTKPYNGLPRSRFGDVLIMATPRPGAPGGSTFDGAAQEAQHLAGWVAGGGSLLLLADHASEFHQVGALVDLFGLTVKPGNFDVDVVSIADGTLENGAQISAALTQGVESVGVESGSAFAPKATLPPATTLTPIIADHPALPVGSWMAVAVEFGSGRAYISGDAGEFSSQFACSLGGCAIAGLPDTSVDNEAFLLNILHWLDGSENP